MLSNYQKYLYNPYEELVNKIEKIVIDVKITNLPKENKTLTVCPNKEWANSLLRSPQRLPELWIKINEIIPKSDEAKQEIAERINRKNELNKLNIRNLYFYTDLGTDFKIGLNTHSIWRCEPNNLDEPFNLINYPSYEIYTSPNCYKAEGKIIISKKKFYYDTTIEAQTRTNKRLLLMEKGKWNI